MMTSCSGSACGCSAWPRSSATCARRAASSGSTRRPTTAGGDRSCAAGSRCSGPASAAHRGCPTRPASSPSSGCSRLPWATRGSGPRRISATLAQERWGGIVISPNGVWRVLRRHGLSRRISRLSLVAGYAAPPEPERPTPLEARHVEVSRPGELVGFDCFHVGRLAGTAGRVWQYTAIDLASSYVWAELATTPLNPSAARHERPGPPGGGRPGRPRLAPRAGADRQRQRVPLGRVRRHGPRAGRDARRSSGPGGRPPTARSSASSARSSRSAGGHPSRAAWCPS